MRRVVLPLCLLLPLSAAAEEPAPTYTVDVRERRPVSAASAFVRDSKAFELRSVSDDPGDLLEVTPGLEVGQHAGGGKADQYLIRGFDADHGTDVALFVDGVPVNIPATPRPGLRRLHCVIPETIEQVEITRVRTRPRSATSHRRLRRTWGRASVSPSPSRSSRAAPSTRGATC